MNRKTLSWILMIGGALRLVTSLAEYLVGIGGRFGFGWKQGIGSLVGVAALAAGAWLARSKDSMQD